jgi:aminoglycoside 6'-N-acetyltransferase
MRIDTGFEPILTPRLVLRRSLPADAATISAYRSDPEVHRHQGWERTDRSGIRAEIEDMARRSPGEPGGWVQLSVDERGSWTRGGDVGLSRADGEPGVIKVGYTIAPAFQGLGYATEAIGALVSYAFDTLGAEVIRAYASAENEPSIRVAEKVGLRLVERIEHREGDEVWHGVRYELRGRSAPSSQALASSQERRFSTCERARRCARTRRGAALRVPSIVKKLNRQLGQYTSSSCGR